MKKRVYSVPRCTIMNIESSSLLAGSAAKPSPDPDAKQSTFVFDEPEEEGEEVEVQSGYMSYPSNFASLWDEEMN